LDTIGYILALAALHAKPKYSHEILISYRLIIFIQSFSISCTGRQLRLTPLTGAASLYSSRKIVIDPQAGFSGAGPV